MLSCLCRDRRAEQNGVHARAITRTGLEHLQCTTQKAIAGGFQWIAIDHRKTLAAPNTTTSTHRGLRALD
jgi:hypothetical protein